MVASAYHVVSKEAVNCVFRDNRVLDTHVYIKNPNWQRKWNYSNFVQVLHNYLRYPDRLLDMFFLLLAVILSELHGNSRRKDWVIEKSTQNNMCEKHHFFGCTLSLWSHFLLLFSSTPLLRGKKKLSPENGEGAGAPCLRPVTILRKGSGANISLWILGNF